MHAQKQDKIKLKMEINVAAEKDNLNFCDIEKKKTCLTKMCTKILAKKKKRCVPQIRPNLHILTK